MVPLGDRFVFCVHSACSFVKSFSGSRSISPRRSSSFPQRSSSGLASGSQRESCLGSQELFSRKFSRPSFCKTSDTMDGAHVSKSSQNASCSSEISTPSTSMDIAVRVERKARNPLGGKVIAGSAKLHGETKFLKLESIQYRFLYDEEGTPTRQWDIASRPGAAKAADGVSIISYLRTSGKIDGREADEGPRLLLVKQFRPALNAVTLELPAGLVDGKESLGETAARELQEETGYAHGRLRKIHGAAAMSSGLTSERVSLVEMDVDESGKGEQCPQGEENIEVVSVPWKKLGEAIKYLEEYEGLIVSQSLSALAVGVSMGMKMGGP